MMLNSKKGVKNGEILSRSRQSKLKKLANIWSDLEKTRTIFPRAISTGAMGGNSGRVGGRLGTASAGHLG